MARYLIISCHVLWRELCYYTSISKNAFDFHFLKQGLHNTPDQLRSELQKAVDEAEGDYDAILLGYGLCSNGLQGITAQDRKLVVMRGHDCMTFFLGSKERYREYFDAHPGTYWYTPGWMDDTTLPGKERYEKMLRKYVEKYGEDNAEYLMEVEQGWYKEYSNAAYVDLGFYDASYCKAHTKQCAQWLGWNYDELLGDAKLIRDFVDGNWDDERFLLVEPGQTIAASNDPRVICVEGR